MVGDEIVDKEDTDIWRNSIIGRGTASAKDLRWEHNCVAKEK